MKPRIAVGAPQLATPTLPELDDAWNVHRALVVAELNNPGLAANPRWKLHRMDAYEDFHNLLTSARDAG